jgi:hypothetical protein
MEKRYQEVPSNFNEIENYVTHEKDEVIDLYFEGEKYFFYDTCSLLHHSNASKKGCIIQYIRKINVTIIITRTVLMELTSNNFRLHPTQVAFIKELHQSNLRVLLFNEEWLVDCLKTMLNMGNEEANQLLGYAIKEVSRSKTATYQIINSMDKPFRSKILGNKPGNVLLYEPFFKYARARKMEKDSLAEELMLICIIVLTRIPRGKFILVSDDLRIRKNVIDINTYLLYHHKVKEPFQLTTSALVYRMYRESVITAKSDMLDILSSAFNGDIKVYYLSEHDISQQYGSFTKEELMDRLISEKEFRIIY